MIKKTQGQLSIHSENIFPIIKKWLYSDHDIFLRELISNGCDAITKLKKLALMGQTELADEDIPALTVRVSAEARTLSVEDNGLGMTADEVSRYINQIAFSGAADFLKKYKDKATDDQIIGHFGLGFYSAFMVADKVTIDSLSWEKGAQAVHWESEGGVSFSLEAGDRTQRGTLITLHLAEDSYEFSNEYRIREVLEKYCSFMPYPIYLINEDAEEEEEEAETAQKTHGEEAAKAPAPLNDTTPLWLKNPAECTEADYQAFYKKLFREWRDPLFTIHLNMDYPFRIQGLLYFPRLDLDREPAEGTIKLYSNQVFIADNIKEVIPEFLLLLKGVIDCPDLPLNVSRSALQNDGFVKKISDYITKKVAEKLVGLFNTRREDYEKYWEDIHPFIKYGCLRDDKFSEKIRKAIIYKNLEGKYVSLDEYLKASVAPEEDEDAQSGEPNEPQKEAEKGAESPAENRSVIYYVTDPVQQAAYVSLFRGAKQDALFFTHPIDEPFIGRLEQRYEDYRFCRIDSDVNAALTRSLSAKKAKEKEAALKPVFEKALARENLSLQISRFRDKKTAALMTFPEESRRMNDMMRAYGMDPAQLPGEETLVLNSDNALVKFLEEKPADERAPLVARQIYDLALMSHKPLTAEEMTAFSERSLKLLEMLIQ